MKLISFFWITPFISFIGGYFLLAHVYRLDTIQAPSLIGLTVQDAFPVVSNHHLNIRLLAFKHDPDLPEGTIVSQTPVASTPIKQNQTIHVVLSQKPAKAGTPTLLNKHKSAIEQELKSRGISLKSYALPSTLPTDTCIGQYPAPGTPLDEPKVIAYLSSDAPKPVLVPQCKQTSALIVLDFLEQHGVAYTVSHVDQPPMNHHCSARCTVVDQRPLAHSIITVSEERPVHMHIHVQHNI